MERSTRQRAAISAAIEAAGRPLLHRGVRHALAAALLVATLAAQAAKEAYVVLIQGAPSGTMAVDADGADVRVAFSYRDNGRGPDMAESWRLGAGQRPLAYEIKGKSTFGGDIGEQFRFADGRVAWTSVADRGDAAAAADALFVPLQATPAYTAQLVRALLTLPGARAPLGTGGTLAVEKLATLQVDGAAGRVPVALYALTGADLAPWTIWLRDDGTAAFFANVAPGWGVLPAGYEAAHAQLLERQRQAQSERLAAVGRRAAVALPGLTLIRGVRWFDAPQARMRGPSDVYLFGGRIAAITAPGALQGAPQQVVDGSGASLLPGLLDMHAHLSPDDGPLYLAAGITTVRDMANQNPDLLQLKDDIDAGLLPGPRIVPAGFIEGSSPFSARNGFVVDSLDAGIQAVDWYAARGYRQIKLYNSVKPEWVKGLAARAHGHGMTVAGHVPAFMRAEQAVEAGYDELTHINQVMLNFFVKPADDTRTLLRFTLVGDRARDVKPTSPQAARFIALLQRKGTAVDPTLSAFEAQFTQRDGQVNPALASIGANLPALLQRSLLQSESSPDEATARRWRASYASMLAFTAALHRAGVPLVAGTDMTAGLYLARELELYVQAGIAPAEALRIATWNGARVAGVGDRAGSIAPGRPADLVLVDGDPTQTIGDVRRTRLVVKGTQAWSPAVLWESMGMKPFAPPAGIERAAAAKQ